MKKRKIIEDLMNKIIEKYIRKCPCSLVEKKITISFHSKKKKHDA